MFPRLFLHAWIFQNSPSRKIILKVGLRRRDFNFTLRCLTSCSGMHLLPEGVDKVEGAGKAELAAARSINKDSGNEEKEEKEGKEE